MDFRYFKIVILKIKNLRGTHAHVLKANYRPLKANNNIIHECLLTEHARNEVVHWKTA